MHKKWDRFSIYQIFLISYDYDKIILESENVYLLEIQKDDIYVQGKGHSCYEVKVTHVVR